MRKLAITMMLSVLLVLPSKAVAGVAAVKHQIKERFGPRHDDTALCVAREEGHYSFGAVGDSGELSTFQILPTFFWHTVSARIAGRVRRVYVNPRLLRARDQRHAIEVAYVMSEGGADWGAWTGTYGRGLCRGLS